MTRAWRQLTATVVVVTALAGSCSGDDGGAPASRAPAITAKETPSGDATGGVFGRIPSIVREVEPSVVAVTTARGEGSGVIWDADGTIVTNHHVVAGVDRVTVAFADGKRANADVRATDPVTDLAVLEADRKGLPAAKFADQLPTIGELAVAMGNPLGFENTVTAGIVSGLGRAIPGSAPASLALVDLIQTDAPISPGNSGGALVDADGSVIGINVAYIPPQASAVSLGFAIPAPTVVSTVTELVRTGEVRHAFFGIQPASLTPQIAERFGIESDAGVLVLGVVPGGPAEEAGMRPGDVVTNVGDRRVGTVEELLAALRQRRPGDRVPITVERDGRSLRVDVTVADRPSR
ncbi:MAG: trypsin-like peptidase domain-containing protein [Actinomycetota bacterium]|nr:trypsin-like peptidase domain-containing protein [Actinomycetota bacterium]